MADPNDPNDYVDRSTDSALERAAYALVERVMVKHGVSRRVAVIAVTKLLETMPVPKQVPVVLEKKP